MSTRWRVMEVRFATSALARRLGQDSVRTSEFGTPVAQRIDLRLQQLHSAPTLAVMRTLPARCVEAAGNPRGYLTIDVAHPVQLIFRPFDDANAHTVGRALNWHAVDSILIIDIIDEQGGRQ